ncbi:TetR family transcriptional regulator [Rhodococcus hoagii]|nr:TetR family transcriptional regulator [Prescottella equi]
MPTSAWPSRRRHGIVRRDHSTSVTVEAIAQRAGVSERTFYRHFPTRRHRHAAAGTVYGPSPRCSRRVGRGEHRRRGRAGGRSDRGTGDRSRRSARTARTTHSDAPVPPAVGSVDDCVVSVLADWLRERSVHPGERLHPQDDRHPDPDGVASGVTPSGFSPGRTRGSTSCAGSTSGRSRRSPGDGAVTAATEVGTRKEGPRPVRTGPLLSVMRVGDANVPTAEPRVARHPDRSWPQ